MHLWTREQGAVLSTCMLSIPGGSVAACTSVAPGPPGRGRNLIDQIAASAPRLVKSSGTACAQFGATQYVDNSASAADCGCGADISTGTCGKG